MLFNKILSQATMDLELFHVIYLIFIMVVPIQSLLPAGDWFTAQDTCIDQGKLLTPHDIKSDHFQQLLDNLMYHERSWINAKYLPVPDSQERYLRFSYVRNNSRSKYLCQKRCDFLFALKSCCKIYKGKGTWDNALGGCQHDGNNLCPVNSLDDGMMVLMLLEQTKSAWIQQYTNNTLPDWDTPGDVGSRLCMAVVKLENETYTVFPDNCSNQYRYHCVQATGRFSPMLSTVQNLDTNLTWTLPRVISGLASDIEPPDDADDDDDSGGGGGAGLIVGVTVPLVIVAIILVFVGVVLYRRHKERQWIAYNNSLSRYKQRRATSSRGGTIETTFCKQSCSVTDSIRSQEPYELTEKKYVTLQKDVVRECGRKLQARHDNSATKLNHLPNYQPMNFPGEPSLEQLRGYECFNPASTLLQPGEDIYENTKNLIATFPKTTKPSYNNSGGKGGKQDNSKGATIPATSESNLAPLIEKKKPVSNHGNTTTHPDNQGDALPPRQRQKIGRKVAAKSVDNVDGFSANSTNHDTQNPANHGASNTVVKNGNVQAVKLNEELQDQVYYEEDRYCGYLSPVSKRKLSHVNYEDQPCYESMDNL